MITPAYAQTMARYNRWQNQSIYSAAGRLEDQQRRRDCGAFFGSLHGTLSHVLFADQIWMHRFAGTPAPRVTTIAESVTAFADWAQMAQERADFDEVIIDWTDRMDTAWLDGDLAWQSGALGRTVSRPKWMLVAHMFNHQTHHRGQAHCMLTQLGVKPDATDVPFMPGLT